MGPMLPASLRAFVSELEKLAAPVVDDAGLAKALKPGDVLYTTPRKNEGLFNKLFYAIESRVQGSPYTHVGLYAGNNQVIDSGDWREMRKGKGKFGVNQVPLDTFKERYKFKVLRPDATPAQRRDAVQYAKDQVGTPFNLRGMLRLVMPGKSDREGFRDRKDAAESLFCSELVSNAYHDLNLVPEKDRRHNHVFPGDIAKSPLVEEVAEYK